MPRNAGNCGFGKFGDLGDIFDEIGAFAILALPRENLNSIIVLLQYAYTQVFVKTRIRTKS